MQAEEPWQVGGQQLMPLPAMTAPKRSSVLVEPSEIFGVSDMNLGTSEDRRSNLPDTAALYPQHTEVYQSSRLQQGLAGDQPLLQGYPISGRNAPLRQASTSQEPIRSLELLPEYLRPEVPAQGPSILRDAAARQSFHFSRRSTPSLPGGSDGSSSTGSRNSPQVPHMRPPTGVSPSQTLHGSPAIAGALRARSHSISALPRRGLSLVSQVEMPVC